MNTDKHHYLKLKEEFFKQDKIAILENSKNGFLFSNILLKLYLLSLKNNGDLLLSSEVKFNAELIAHLTGHKEAIVGQALVRFKELDLMKEIENNSLSMTDFQLFHETSTVEPERKKAYRHKVKMGQIEKFVPEMSQDCPDKVPEQSPESPVDVTDLSQTCHEAVPQKGEDCPQDVPDLSQQEGNQVPEMVQQPYSYSPPRSKKSGDEVPTFPKGRPLKSQRRSQFQKKKLG